MNDLEAAELICVVLQKLKSGNEILAKLIEQKKRLEAREIQYETRDCPVWTDIEYEPLLRDRQSPFSKEYINSSIFQKKYMTYLQKKRTGKIGYFDNMIYEDQIIYHKYLEIKEDIDQKNNIIRWRNEEKQNRRLTNKVNIPIQQQRKQEAIKKRNEELAWYNSMIIIFQQGVAAAEKIRNILYDRYRIAPKVRNLESMLQIYEYLWSNQAPTIGEATYRYSLLGAINNLLETLRKIAADQTKLQRSVSDMAQGNLQILEQLKALNTMSESIRGTLTDMNETLNSINTMKLGDV